MKEPIADRNISILTKDQLEDFIKSEKIKGKNIDYDDLLYVESDDYTDCYGIYLKQTLCGYICVYKNNPRHCDKLYISSEHRRKGLAHFALDFLGVTSVWVLTKNKVAMDFYTSIGFKINSKHGEISVMGRKSITNKSLKADFTKW
jgi:GNAT superfamily N-acetyltransferase